MLYWNRSRGMFYTHIHNAFIKTHAILHSHTYSTINTCFYFLITAMQMWTLARFLPLIIGPLIPEDNEHWEKILCLLDILDILFASPISPSVCGDLEALISDHHSTFIELYPFAKITMKMHSMVHLPRLLLM